MKRNCPICSSSPEQHTRRGHFVRRSDGRRIRRYQCRRCGKAFSDATFQLCYRQKKRRLNPRIREALASLNSQRRIAMLLKISRTTVARKLVFLAKVSRIENQKDLERQGPIYEMQFDELETIEHTRLKPLSVLVAVEKTTRTILGFEVSQMAAKGPLAIRSVQKYGPRKDCRYDGQLRLFERLQDKVSPGAIIQSDQNPHYLNTVRKYFPHALHVSTPGLPGCVAGQAELKKAEFDPLFSINHTLAMMRANVNRLIKKTWCVSKRADRLADHIDIYVNYHNRVLLQSPT